MSKNICKAISIGTIFLWAISPTQGSEYKYMYNNNGTCIDVKMDVLFTLSDGNETVKFDGNNLTVESGGCANEGKYESYLMLRTSKGNNLVLIFKILLDLSVNMSSRFIFVPAGYFPGKPKDWPFSLPNTTDLKLGSYNQLYQCESTQRMTLTGELGDTTYTMFIDMSNVQIQAFNIMNGTLSTDGVHCEADIGPIPAPGYSPVNIYSVFNGNNTCVVFKGSIELNIPYISKAGITTEVVSLPAVYSVSGECNTTLNGLYSQKMVIRFYAAWTLTIYFTSDKNQETDVISAGTASENYYVSQIELKYDYNNIIFNDAVDSILGKEMSVVADNLRKLTTNNNKSYKCQKETTFHLQNGLYIVTKDLQYQAFKTGNTTDFSAAVNCDKEEDRHYILYIVIGAAAGGCLLLVVLAVTVYVKSKRRKYEQINSVKIIEVKKNSIKESFKIFR